MPMKVGKMMNKDDVKVVVSMTLALYSTDNGLMATLNTSAGGKPTINTMTQEQFRILAEGFTKCAIDAGVVADKDAL